MAKALFGHVGGPDARLLAEVATLRRRVRELESEVMRLGVENETLIAISGQVNNDIISLDATAESVGRAAPALA